VLTKQVIIVSMELVNQEKYNDC